MIETVRIRNFKSIEELDIELAPLTIFVGPNGSGKTTILEAIALMRQSAQEGKSIFESLKGEFVDFEDKKSILLGKDETKLLSLGFSIHTPAESLRLILAEDLDMVKRAAESTKTSQPPNPLETKRLSMIHKWLSKLNISLLAEKSKEEAGIGYRNSSKSDLYFFHHHYSVNECAFKTGFRQGRQISVPKINLIPQGNYASFLPTPSYGYQDQFLQELAKLLRSALEHVYYLSSERGNIPWTKMTSAQESNWVGRRGEHTLEILATLLKPEYDENRLPYELFFESFGVKHAWAGWAKSNLLTSNYTDKFLKVSLMFPSLGYGSKQLIPIIVQLAYSDPGSVVLIEEPETSLHPGFQRLLPILFGRAVNEGKQVITTTHSSYFPISLSLPLKGYEVSGQTSRGKRKFKIKLSTEEVAVYHVFRDREGFTKTERLKIDKGGLKEGIPSFIDVEKEILGQFIEKE